MLNITQEGRYRLSLLQYAERHGVTQSARKYHRNRQFIYRLRCGITVPSNPCFPNLIGLILIRHSIGPTKST